MNGNHTPAPWSIYIRSVRMDTDIWEEVDIIHESNQDGAPVGHIGHVKSPNTEADARLIAAAPDLYEALDTLINYGHSANWHEAFQPLIRKARYALAKARGDASEGEK